MTGAPLPGRRRRGRAGRVDRRRRPARSRSRRARSPARHVRRSGRGRARRGVVLDAGHPARARAARPARRGRARTASWCGPRPRVVVLSTGSELVEPGTPSGRGQICESNRFVLTAAAARPAPSPSGSASSHDDPRALLDTHRGPADPRRPGRHHRRGQRRRLRRRQGGAVRGSAPSTSSKVAMQPGKPQGFGIDRPGPHADLRAARQPGQRVRLVRGVRAAGAAPDARRPDRCTARPCGAVCTEAAQLPGRATAVTCAACSTSRRPLRRPPVGGQGSHHDRRPGRRPTR